MKKSERLQAVWNELANQPDCSLEDVADSSCTSGYDNDGSTGFEIFENGFDLAVKAAGRPVFYFETEEDSDMTLFFIGTEDEIEARLRARRE